MTGRSAPRETFIAAAAVVLTSSALGSVYDSWRWLGTVLAVVVVVAAAGLACRQLRVPIVLHPVVTAAALVVLATVRFARHDAFAGFLPTRTSWHGLYQQYQYGIHDLSHFSPAIVTTTGTLMVATAGVGLVALAVDLVAVSARRPTLAGIPLLLLVVVPSAAHRAGIGIVPFVLAGLGFLWLLALDAASRAGRWGRVLSAASSRSFTTEATASGAGWRIGATTLAVALAVPVLIPGARVSPFDSHSGGSGGGSTSTRVVNPFVQVRTQLEQSKITPLLQVRTTAPTYLRLTALESFDPNGFGLLQLSAGERDRVNRGLPVPDTGSGTIATAPTRDTIKAVGGYAQSFLPVPQSTTKVDVHGDWRLSAPTSTIFSSRTTTQDQTWNATAAVPAPTVTTLEGAGTPQSPAIPYSPALDVDTFVPTGIPSLVEATARGWVRQAHATTTYEIAAALQRRFTGPEFHYDLRAQVGSGLVGFAQFLNDRRGYCQQYASTMVTMLRILGIPARVAIGFTAGTRQPDGSYVITNKNAHAWPEVWFATAGWVRFEPTPLPDGTAQTPGYTVPGSGNGATNPGQAPAPLPSAAPSAGGRNGDGSLSNKLRNLGGEKDAGTAAAAAAAAKHSSTSVLGVPASVLVLLGILLLAVLLAVPRCWFALARRRQWRRCGAPGHPGAADVAWQHLLEDAADRGVRIPSSHSPRAAGRLLGRLVAPRAPGAEAAIALLVGGVERARYAPTDIASGRATDDSAAELRAAVTALRRGTAATLPRSQAVAATLFPRSAWRRITEPLATAGGRVSGGVDSVAGLGVFVLRRLRRPVRDA